MLSALLAVDDCDGLAGFFGLKYDALAKLAYGMPDSYKYTEFTIPKKQGGIRRIHAPCKRLKQLQSRLKDALYEAYKTPKAVHGFALDKSIITNAQGHLDKSVILNLDLEDFFGSINFGRVRGLFMSSPFRFDASVATVLAQLCCFHGALPQGAPTSPVIANMISYTMDRQFLALARDHRATYTRYADDITFSFTVKRSRLPRDIVRPVEDGFVLGDKLVGVITENGFAINESKVRLADKHSRMSVTGITVNETPNVSRRFVRQIRAMLRAWDVLGLQPAEVEFNTRWNKHHRASEVPKAFPNVVRGRLLFLRNVRGMRDDIYCRAATQFNELAKRDGFDKLELKVVSPSATEKTAHKALWVVESDFTLGSGFSAPEGFVVTCAHCARDKDDKPLPYVTVFKSGDISSRWKAEVVAVDENRDLALCLPIGFDMNSETSIDFSDTIVEHGSEALLLGFPGYSEGSRESRIATYVSNPRLVTPGGVERFEIDKTIHHGASGGPVVAADGRLLGVAVEGAVAIINRDTLCGRNTVVHYSEVRAFIESCVAERDTGTTAVGGDESDEPAAVSPTLGAATTGLL